MEDAAAETIKVVAVPNLPDGFEALWLVGFAVCAALVTEGEYKVNENETGRSTGTDTEGEGAKAGSKEMDNLVLVVIPPTLYQPQRIHSSLPPSLPSPPSLPPSSPLVLLHLQQAGVPTRQEEHDQDGQGLYVHKDGGLGGRAGNVGGLEGGKGGPRRVQLLCVSFHLAQHHLSISLSPALAEKCHRQGPINRRKGKKTLPLPLSSAARTTNRLCTYSPLPPSLPPSGTPSK